MLFFVRDPTSHVEAALMFSIGTHNFDWLIIGSLHDPVTWHGINYAGTQITQWDLQNKGKSGWNVTSAFVLEVPLRYLRPRIIFMPYHVAGSCKGLLRSHFAEHKEN